MKSRANLLGRIRQRLRRDSGPAILMYHRVAEDPFDPWALAITPKHFREQLRWLGENRAVLPLVEFARKHREGALPATALAITFDDGDQSVTDIAAPALREVCLPATVFIPAELIARHRPFWWDELRSLVLDHDGASLTIGDEVVAIGAADRADGCWAPGAPPGTARQQAFQRIWAMLRDKPPAEIDRAMEALRRQSPASPAGSPRPMSPGEIAATASEAIEFGSHALTHPWLTSLAAEEKKREIGESVEACERLTGRKPASFAYPYGSFDAESERLVEEAGFVCACATLDRAVRASSRAFALPRIAVGNWSAEELAKRLGG